MVIGDLHKNYHFKNSGLIFLTLDEWKKIKEIDGIKLERQIGAVFSIKPSVSYILSTYYKKLNITQQGNRLTIVGELHKNIFDLFQKHFGLSYRGNELIFKFKNAEELQENVQKLEKNGIELPKPHGSIMTFQYGVGFYKKQQSDLNLEAFRLKRALKRYFPNNPFELSYTTDYSFDFVLMDNGADELDRNEEAFWNELFTKIHGEDFQVSQSRRTISFDFETEEELIQNTNFVKSFSICDTSDYGDKHKFKYNIKFETGLHELQDKLKKEFPNLNTKLITNGEKLIFRKFYKSGEGNQSFTRDNLTNQLSEILDKTDFTFEISNHFNEKYICEENFELKIEQEEEKLSKLLRSDFYACNEGESKIFDIGKLTKVDYPDLTFSIEAENLDGFKENFESFKNKIQAIKPDLKGEKDKIKRLEDTVLKLESEQELPNNNAKEFLYDSSKAKGIENIDYLLNKTSSEWQEFEDNLFSESLNESQKQAIYKSLYAEELALIQGPPGTGKSTAIAEIIWQHIRKGQNQKILLTSETNLAVDNAIDRLKNSQNNLVKPIRFGNEEKLDSEGYFYSLSAIESWENGKEDEKNTVAHWIENITSRIANQDNEQIDAALEKWKIHLQKPDSKTKNLFANKYLEYVNLIGATGSSIGKLNSEGRWTSFFHSYLNVFYNTEYLKSRNYSDEKERKINKYFCYQQEISFDTIIMDEASKATPPELALPVVYGKKAIIVGDHRQLPPMIDGEEIKDLLISIGERKLAKTLSQKEFETSQFERLFLNIDESIKGTFDTQYRMHPAINDAIAQFYKEDSKDGLKCGLPIEETYHNSFDNWDSRYHGLSFENIVTPETHTIWINVNTPEIKEGTSRVNFGEIEAIDNILTVLKNSKGKNEFDDWLSTKSLEEKQIGLISFYGKQIHYINKMLKEKHNETPIRLSTVDRFQGMERNIIIVSMVRSNKIASFQGQEADYDLYPDIGYQQQDSLGFAQSPNRLNVALSRARRLLIVVGNSKHFCQKPIYKNVFETIRRNGKIIDYDELQKVVEQYG